jgi:anaerobic magnesium-protoporphyrin IX monomethyl ester cyclase
VARVFLINPPSPEPVRTPLLSFCHLAASLRAAGHDVALHDASAPFATTSVDEIHARLAAFAPDLVGLHVKTLHAQPAYALAAELAARGWPLVAGGPHATICPDEPFTRGFRWVVRGEGEETLVELADVLDGKRAAADVASLSWKDRGLVRHNPSRGFLLDLDVLASPASALDLFDPAWYGQPRPIPPAGLLSSRGCPAACTFCANNVTGRRFRYRAAEGVAGEIAELHDAYGMSSFSFFDDSFAVGRRRVRELCDAIRAIGRPVTWTCTAHPSHLDREILVEMQRAGCRGVDIGMESADPGMLVRIGKGVTVERVLDVLGWCTDLGLHCVVNLMFGWPDETDAELEATIDFLDRAAPVASGFNARGVLVPYPGTEIYDAHHERHGFTEWWLREAPLPYRPFPTTWSQAEIERAYADDPALERNYFRHPPHRLRLIEEALKKKASHTIGAIARAADRATAAATAKPAA